MDRKCDSDRGISQSKHSRRIVPMTRVPIYKVLAGGREAVGRARPLRLLLAHVSLPATVGGPALSVGCAEPRSLAHNPGASLLVIQKREGQRARRLNGARGAVRLAEAAERCVTACTPANTGRRWSCGHVHGPAGTRSRLFLPPALPESGARHSLYCRGSPCPRRQPG
jgi:hypothetical protein